MFKNKGIAFKLAFYILTGVLLIFAVIMYIDYAASRRTILQGVHENASYQALSTVKTIEGVLKAAAKIPENLAPILENGNYSEAQIGSFLQPIVEQNPEVFGACVAFEPYAYSAGRHFFAPYYYKNNGQTQYKVLGDSLYNYFYLDRYQIPQMLGHPVWSEPYFDENGGNIIMATYSVPFYKKENGRRRFAGVTTVDIDLSWLRGVVDSIRLVKGGYAFLISRQGTFLTHPVDSLVMNESIFSVASETHNERLRDIGQSMIRGETAFIRYNPFNYDGKAWLYYTRLPASRWSLAIIFPEEALMSGLVGLYRTLLVLGLAGLMLLWLVITLISRRITRPATRLAAVSEEIGSGNFDVPLPPVRNRDEIGRLTQSFGLMTQELKTYIHNLEETTAAKNRIESELRIAHDIQQGIIPKIFPPFPEREDVDLYAVLDPAKEVGGDLYDFFFVDDSHLVFAIGDVSGKGVPASLFMAITRTLLRARAVPGKAAADMVSEINNELCIDNENAMFVTFFLGVLDLESGDLDYCNAGHNYPYLMRADSGVEQLAQTHGTPLGLFENMPYKSGRIRLQRNDAVALYTDGIPEAMNNKNELHGDDRLKKLLDKIPTNSPPEEITRQMLNSAKDFAAGAEQSDDITILVLTYYLNKTVVFNVNEKQIDIVNRMDELNRVDAFTQDLAEQWKLPPADTHKINLVLEEIITNIIKYGFDDNRQHHINIIAAFENDTVKIRVQDMAKPFNPLEREDPKIHDVPLEQRDIGGLGIFFVKKMMDRVSYTRKEGRNILDLEKHIKH